MGLKASVIDFWWVTDDRVLCSSFKDLLAESFVSS